MDNKDDFGLFNMAQVTEMTGMSAGWIKAAMERGEFPRQVKISERRRAWHRRDIREWINSREVIK